MVNFRQVFGSEKGVVFIVKETSGEITTLIHESRVLDVHSLGEIVAFAYEGVVGVYNSSRKKEEMRLNLPGVKLVRIIETDIVTIVAMTETEVVLIQKGWIRNKEMSIFKAKSGIRKMEINLQTLVVASKDEVSFLDLPSGKVLRTLKISNESLDLVWIRDGLCGLFTPENYRFIETQGFQPISAPGFLAKTDEIFKNVYGPATFAAFHLFWVLILTPDLTIRVINTENKLEFSAKTDFFGKIVTKVGNRMDFYIVSTAKIEKFAGCSQEDHIEWLLSKGKFQAAVDFLSGKNKPKAFIYAKWLISVLDLKGIAAMKNFALRLVSEGRLSWENLFDFSCSEPRLFALIPYVPETAVSEEGFKRVLIDLGKSRSDETFLTCIKQWPESLISNEFLAFQIRENAPFSVQAEFYLRRKDYPKAIEAFLVLKNERVFAILEMSPNARKEFIGKMTMEQVDILGKMDAEKTAMLMIERWEDWDGLRNTLSPDLAYQFAVYLWKAGKTISKSASDFLLEEMIKRKNPDLPQLLKSAPNPDWDTALKLSQESTNLQAKLLLFPRFQRQNDLIPLLKSDFFACVSYLQRNWNEPLWRWLLEENLPSENAVNRAIPYLYAHLNPVIYSLGSGFGLYSRDRTIQIRVLCISH